MEDLSKDIDNALNANVDMTKEEYAALTAEMDSSTNKHGVPGKAPLKESERHKRIQSNFYGTALNLLVNMYQILYELKVDVENLKKEGSNGDNTDNC